MERTQVWVNWSYPLYSFRLVPLGLVIGQGPLRGALVTSGAPETGWDSRQMTAVLFRAPRGSLGPQYPAFVRKKGPLGSYRPYGFHNINKSGKTNHLFLDNVQNGKVGKALESIQGGLDPRGQLSWLEGWGPGPCSGNWGIIGPISGSFE